MLFKCHCGGAPLRAGTNRNDTKALTTEPKERKIEPGKRHFFSLENHDAKCPNFTPLQRKMFISKSARLEILRKISYPPVPTAAAQ
jgi:hypothetical protein